MSYFAKPHYIKYDEWFDEDFKKNKLDIKNKETKVISKIHDFFYEQSNYKTGASENFLKSDITVNEKKLFKNYYLKKTLEKNISVSPNKFNFYEKLPKRNFEFNITKKIIYFLSIFSFLLVLVLFIFFISSHRKSESNIINTFLSLKK